MLLVVTLHNVGLITGIRKVRRCQGAYCLSVYKVPKSYYGAYHGQSQSIWGPPTVPISSPIFGGPNYDSKNIEKV